MLPPTLPVSPALEALVREAVAAAPSGPPELLAHLAGAALWRYVGEAERERPERPRPVVDARRFIRANLGDPALKLADIARAAHVTPAHLIRSFRAEHGTTPMAYLWERRVAVGVDLLGSTGLPIATVAERCGFRTAHHFSRRVRQATGLPPGALRRALGGAVSYKRRACTRSASTSSARPRPCATRTSPTRSPPTARCESRWRRRACT